MESQDSRKFIKDVEKAESWPGPVIGTPPSRESVQQAKDNIEKADSYKEKQEKKVSWTYYIQVYGFVLGVFLNLIFVTVNYLD